MAHYREKEKLKQHEESWKKVMNLAKSNPQVTDDKRYAIPACTSYAYSLFGNRGPFIDCKTIIANTCCGVYVN